MVSINWSIYKRKSFFLLSSIHIFIEEKLELGFFFLFKKKNLKSEVKKEPNTEIGYRFMPNLLEYRYI